MLPKAIDGENPSFTPRNDSFWLLYGVKTKDVFGFSTVIRSPKKCYLFSRLEKAVISQQDLKTIPKVSSLTRQSWGLETLSWNMKVKIV